MEYFYTRAKSLSRSRLEEEIFLFVNNVIYCVNINVNTNNICPFSVLNIHNVHDPFITVSHTYIKATSCIYNVKYQGQWMANIETLCKNADSPRMQRIYKHAVSKK